MHRSFLHCEFVQAQLWRTPKFLQAIDEAFGGTLGIPQEQWEKKTGSISSLKAVLCELLIHQLWGWKSIKLPLL